MLGSGSAPGGNAIPQGSIAVFGPTNDLVNFADHECRAGTTFFHAASWQGVWSLSLPPHSRDTGGRTRQDIIRTRWEYGVLATEGVPAPDTVSCIDLHILD